MKQKPTPTLICIPDISGFTEFMSAVDIELSSKIIPALLNKVIYANNIGLKVSEIEGDAVLFYKSDGLPSFKDLIDQCRLFYTEFYKQLHLLDEIYKYKAKGIEIPEVLGLKVILHFGEKISAVQIGKNIKLMGEDLITAHRLLKNKIPFDEYILLSQNIIEQYEKTSLSDNFDWGQLHKKDTSFQHIGDISYSYINLKPLVD
ncbi:DUF2652 domain-containing protein [Hyunsoonleella sp. 2307UL5-6]|uniref:DUF2652 domain-containing protein n=1 Tax=Hyunsoonleella sp. 2307UL5-6 TaxID=3384768 RepID=UPI0039BCB126